MEEKIYLEEKTLTADDRKPLETLKRATYHIDSRYELRIAWKDATKPPSKYFLDKAQLQSPENRHQQEPDFFSLQTNHRSGHQRKFVGETQHQCNLTN